jgi:hypothetical protein
LKNYSNIFKRNSFTNRLEIVFACHFDGDCDFMNFDFESAESYEIALNHSSPKYSRRRTFHSRANENSSGYLSVSPSYSPLYSENTDVTCENQENLQDYSCWLNSYNPFDSYSHLESNNIDENLFLFD